ncbi:MAG TPA: methyltransferase domain-containing protein [Candidatus Sulfotelmatobacter sp.]|nr:methyltransferase domain-containing protein [Candidatus Sulfotelmatobacter sp.]
MDETSKSRKYWGDLEKSVLVGKGIDIGCGPDPVTPDARRFDLEHGDANFASRYVSDQFDFVYSSHCLEHMHDPRATILDWWKLVKPGGHLFVMVPDEDLYEQGVFPSRFNPDHKATFTISKAKSWSPKSVNVLDLAWSLPNGQIVSLQLQDRGYNHLLAGSGRLQPDLFVRFLAKCRNGLDRLISSDGSKGLGRFLASYYTIDQTMPPFEAQAQIQLIVKKLATG